MAYIRDNKGAVIGNAQKNGSSTTYNDKSGRPVARVTTDSNGRQRTNDGSGRFVGYGDQGMRKL